jgi:hypothetical protein
VSVYNALRLGGVRYTLYMADVIFDEEQQNTPRTSATKSPSSITKLVYKLGLAKTQQSADFVMISVIVLCFVLIGVILWSSGALAIL